MGSPLALVLLMAGSVSWPQAGVPSVPSPQAGVPWVNTLARNFRVQQTYEVSPLPAGAKDGTLLAPLPPDDPWQTVTDLSIDGAPFEIVHDAAHGNAAARFQIPAAGAKVHVSFQVVRRERSADLSSATQRPAPDGYADWLRDDRLVVVDDLVRRIARDVTTGLTAPRAKAEAIYAYVLSHMRYLKQGQGWGQGSLRWACDEKYGNCTDFHSLFIGLLRASGIPARFQIGYSVPSDTTSGELPGYHCWADFYLDGVGWVPVDVSEAWKAPAKRDYFFGHHDANRFALSTGRDLAFPGLIGPTLNYFVFPVLEVSGRRVDLVSHRTAFAEIAP
jgi:transglutaminase-like putative cysteine protease